MTTITYKSNIKCGGCIATVTPLLNAEPLISSWEVDVQTPSKVLTINTEETDVEKITKLVQQTLKPAGFTIEEL